MKDNDLEQEPTPTPTPQQVPTPTPTPTPTDEPPKQDLPQIISEIKKGYEEKLAKQKSEYDAKLSERDNVIKQLLNGEQTEQEKSIADLINEKREQYLKKW